MNAKDTMNFVQLQELVVSLLVRITALEYILKDANVLNVEKYNEELTKLTAVVSDKVQKALNDLDKSKKSQDSSSLDADVEKK